MVMSRKQVTNSQFIAAFSHVNAFKSNLKLNKSIKMKLKDHGTRVFTLCDLSEIKFCIVLYCIVSVDSLDVCKPAIGCTCI